MTYLVKMLAGQTERYPDREVLKHRPCKGGAWESVSWRQFKNLVDKSARALASYTPGLDQLDRIAVCSPNTPQVLITELAAFSNRMASTPLYPSASQQQVDFILDDCNARILFIGDKNQYPMAYTYWKTHPNRLLAIVHFDNRTEKFQADDTISITWEDFIAKGNDSALDQIVTKRSDEGSAEDLATLIYTSGTTGEPKGVMLCHEQYEAAIRMHLEMLTYINDEDVSLSFLPMSHIFEKAWCYFCLTRGIRIAINYDPRSIQDTIQEIHPNIMCCVPRFWEKVYTATRKKIASIPRWQRLMVSRALKVGKQYNLNYRRLNSKPPTLLRIEYNFWNKRVFLMLKKAIGIPNPNFFPTAGAPISDRICSFFRSVGIDIVVGYGLSETTATVSCFRESGFEIGTAGKPLPNVQVRIGEGGEVLVKGKSVMKGYYNNPEANKSAFTSDGFFRTGDAGYITKNGELTLTERIKDLFKTSNGKYIAPQALETRLAEDDMIDQVAIIGNNRQYVTALVVPNFHELKIWAKKNSITYSETKELVQNPRAVEMVMSRIRPLQKNMAHFEQIKKITLLPNYFSIMDGEVTNTMKVRRKIVEQRYSAEIKSMYR